MTAGCSHGPNSHVHCDFAFCELTLCSMLKYLSHEIAIAGSSDTRPFEMDGLDHIGALEPQDIRNPHYRPPKMTSSMVQISCHVPF
jgi:hypothetical protein